MREWGYWEWLTYGCIAVAALIPVADMAFSATERMKNVMDADFWKFLPAALVAISAIVIVARGVGWLDAARTPAMPKVDDKPLEQVTHQKFMNTEVVLDGKAFTDCEFINVTFVFNGTAPFWLQHNHIRGSRNFRSDNETITATFALLYGLGALDKSFQDSSSNPTANIQRPTFADTEKK